MIIIRKTNDITKQCTKCKEVKEITNFTKSSNTADGFRHHCIECRSKEAKTRRLLNGGVNHVDRSIETENTKICTNCLQLKDKSQFKHKSWCVDCIKQQNRKYAESKGIKEKFVPIVNEDSKQCCKCKEIKLLSEYSNSTKGRLGKSAYCKKCFSFIMLDKTTNEERRIKTQTYRNNNREWWRFLHRINQFNRKNKVKLASDGTITKEFMIKLYETEECYYCKNIINKENRTCEHKQPLNKGGVHGISNLVMACNNCNSTKRDMTENEFNNYINQKHDKN